MKTLLLLITLVFSVLGCEEELLDCATETVAGGSYKYYSLTHEGYIRIRLESVSGDADLYVSQVTTKPTYEPSEYCLQSSSCGEDTVLIPSSFKRPVTVAVYGHPSHETTEFSILVFQMIGNDLSHDLSVNDSCKKTKNQDGNKFYLVTIVKKFLLLFLELFF